ncbi:MAG: hypothetical protein ACLSE4_02220 [Clostridium sp.]
MAGESDAADFHLGKQQEQERLRERSRTVKEPERGGLGRRTGIHCGTGASAWEKVLEQVKEQRSLLSSGLEANEKRALVNLET